MSAAKSGHKFVQDNKIKSVIEFGCGDGNQLALFKMPQYTGIDVSETAIKMCKDKMKGDKTKEFFVYNNKNTYCAFWIYTKEDFNNFLSSVYFDVNNIQNYGLRERCAIGLYGLAMFYYNGTLIPCDISGLDKRCRIYHLLM